MNKIKVIVIGFSIFCAYGCLSEENANPSDAKNECQEKVDVLNQKLSESLENLELLEETQQIIIAHIHEMKAADLKAQLAFMKKKYPNGKIGSTSIVPYLVLSQDLLDLMPDIVAFNNSATKMIAITSFEDELTFVYENIKESLNKVIENRKISLEVQKKCLTNS